VHYYSTNGQAPVTDLRGAVLHALPPDNGLYLPERIPTLSKGFIEFLPGLSFQEIAFTMAQAYLEGDIPKHQIQTIVDSVFSFEAPLVSLTEWISLLELFHGPTLAFKDFGARFMARLMGYFTQETQEELVILVATSGDTGSAVAHAFCKVPGIRVYILYPSGRISTIQEQQLTTLGYNITALEIGGSFDDCQHLVKTAFLDENITSALQLTSANSINIARLIPQTFYYAAGLAQYRRIYATSPPVTVVPCGNFGNLTAGLLAAHMGLELGHFVAATNQNDVVPQYLATGTFKPRPSVATISNAMDVGNPSNWGRILDLYRHDLAALRRTLSSWSYTDSQTRETIQRVYQEYHYCLDPHTAVGYLGMETYRQQNALKTPGIVLATAHPAKFLAVVEPLIGHSLPLPASLEETMQRPKSSVQLSNRYIEFRDYLLSQ
jgi:threonine synthase